MELVPYVISWNLTTRCNLRCKHCYIDASTPMPGELSTAEALRVVNEIAEVNPETLLIPTGGGNIGGPASGCPLHFEEKGGGPTHPCKKEGRP